MFDRCQESTGGASSGHYPDKSDSEASTFRLPGRKLFDEISKTGDGESPETGDGDLSVGSSSLSRYIVSNPGRRQVRSCNAPSPEALPVRVGQLLSQFRDPEDSLFYKSSLGEDSDGGYSDSEESSSASTIVITRDVEPQDEGVEGSPGRKIDKVEESPSENALRTMIGNAVKAMAEEPGTGTAEEAGAARSVKRSRAARYGPEAHGSQPSWNDLAFNADRQSPRTSRAITPVNSTEKRAAKRSKIVQEEIVSVET